MPTCHEVIGQQVQLGPGVNRIREQSWRHEKNYWNFMVRSAYTKWEIRTVCITTAVFGTSDKWYNYGCMLR
jgi:hypothetical protein